MNTDINWEEVEGKIHSICNRFSNISEYREDLAQELRIHAYYKNDSYTSLYNCAISFYRKVSAKEFPEVPYFNLEDLNYTYEEKDLEKINFIELVTLIRRELMKPRKTKWEENHYNVVIKLFDYIIEDIDPSYCIEQIIDIKNNDMNHYINGRLSLTWVSEETGIGYKRLVKAMHELENIVKDLNEERKLETKYF